MCELKPGSTCWDKLHKIRTGKGLGEMLIREKKSRKPPISPKTDRRWNYNSSRKRKSWSPHKREKRSREGWELYFAAYQLSWGIQWHLSDCRSQKYLIIHSRINLEFNKLIFLSLMICWKNFKFFENFDFFTYIFSSQCPCRPQLWQDFAILYIFHHFYCPAHGQESDVR